MGVVEFLIVLAGGSVTTFFALAIIEMIRKGRALRARGERETTRDAKSLAPGFMSPVRRSTPEAIPVERPADLNAR